MTEQTSTPAPAAAVVFTPSAPVAHGGKTYPSLTLRKMKARDMVSADLVNGETRKTFAIYASMADVPIGVIEELDADDYDRLEEVAAPLMGKSWKARTAKLEKLAESIMEKVVADAVKDMVPQ